MKPVGLILLLFAFSSTLFAIPKASAKIIPYRKGDLWGFCDPAKNMIVPAIYQNVEICFANLLCGNGPGMACDFYNAQGKKLLTVDMRWAPYENGYAKFSQNKQIGVIDSNGRIVIPAQFRELNGINEDLFVGLNNNGPGSVVFDTSGRVMFRLDSGTVRNFYKGRGWIETRTMLGSVDRKGKVKWFKKDKNQYNPEFHNEFMLYTTGPNYGSQGMIDQNGKTIITHNGTSSIRFLSDDLIQVERGEWNDQLYDTKGKAISIVYADIFIARENEDPTRYTADDRKGRKIYEVTKEVLGAPNMYGLIDSTGAVILPAEYFSIGPINEGAFYVVKDGKYGFYDIRGKQLTPVQYDEAGSFHHGITWVKEKGKYRVINRKGKYITNEFYDEVRQNTWKNNDSIIGVSANRKFGYINYYGKTVVPFQYDEANMFLSENKIGIRARKDSLWGTFDAQGNVINPVEYAWLSYPKYPGGYSWGLRRGKYYVLDSVGNETPLVADFMVKMDANGFAFGYGHVYINGKRQYVNTKGEILEASLIYDEVHAMGGWFLVVKDKKVGVLNAEQQLILPVKYDAIQKRISPTLFLVIQDKKQGYVNVNGTEYFED